MVIKLQTAAASPCPRLFSMRREEVPRMIACPTVVKVNPDRVDNRCLLPDIAQDLQPSLRDL